LLLAIGVCRTKDYGHKNICKVLRTGGSLLARAADDCNYAEWPVTFSFPAADAATRAKRQIRNGAADKRLEEWRVAVSVIEGAEFLMKM